MGFSAGKSRETLVTSFGRLRFGGICQRSIKRERPMGGQTLQGRHCRRDAQASDDPQLHDYGEQTVATKAKNRLTGNTAALVIPASDQPIWTPTSSPLALAAACTVA